MIGLASSDYRKNMVRRHYNLSDKSMDWLTEAYACCKNKEWPVEIEKPKGWDTMPWEARRVLIFDVAGRYAYLKRLEEDISRELGKKLLEERFEAHLSCKWVYSGNRELIKSFARSTPTESSAEESEDSADLTCLPAEEGLPDSSNSSSTPRASTANIEIRPGLR